jgi:hypothetical protein
MADRPVISSFGGYQDCVRRDEREEQIAVSYRHAYSTAPLSEDEREMLDAAVVFVGNDLERMNP